MSLVVLGILDGLAAFRLDNTPLFVIALGLNLLYGALLLHYLALGLFLVDVLGTLRTLVGFGLDLSLQLHGLGDRNAIFDCPSVLGIGGGRISRLERVISPVLEVSI